VNKFFCRNSDIEADKIIISAKEDVHHIKNVLRLKAGKKVEISDESGNSYVCEISEIGDKVRLVIKNTIPSAGRNQEIELTVAVAIPKKAKIDDIIDKLVQLGVNRIIPLKTERVIVKLDRQKEASRFVRWKRIALCAAKQCKGNDFPVIEPVASFRELIVKTAEFDLKLIPHLSGDRQSLKSVLSIFFSEKDTGTPKAASRILVLIGPEGDFSGNEVNLALSAGFIPVTLGSCVLRVDTAAISAASFIKLYAHH